MKTFIRQWRSRLLEWSCILVSGSILLMHLFVELSCRNFICIRSTRVGLLMALLIINSVWKVLKRWRSLSSQPGHTESPGIFFSTSCYSVSTGTLFIYIETQKKGPEAVFRSNDVFAAALGNRQRKIPWAFLYTTNVGLFENIVTKNDRKGSVHT